MNGSEASGPKKPKRQDLSYADQQELLAFVEKRRWFEGKLESLKALAPVYPFVHPVLVPCPTSTAGYVRAGAESSPWRLPNKAQLAAWVNERNALVDEVERFDDGDMERMKEKTRQMTRVPLTQPSTDLVEVTLDLILLIDQLLQVLRSRGSILELASLRLQWDDLRYEVRRETESVKMEIDHVVTDAQAWLPGAALASRWEPRRRGSEYTPPSPRVPASPRIPPSSSDGSLATTDTAPSTPPLEARQILRSPARTLSPTKHQGSPTKPHNVPRSALHLSILRSQLVGLQTRHKNLQYNLIRRSGAILDRMIDQAGKLKDLGGVDGPLQEEDRQRQQAIPDCLIDLQEELETRATDIGDRVAWCSSFEHQCRKGHDHFSRSARAQKAATDFMAEIQAALGQPASSHKHAALAQMYAEASAVLPPPVDADSLPMPSHPSFPSKDDHNEAVFVALSEARDDAEADLDIGGKVLAYYSALLNARQALQAQHARVQTLRDHLQRAVELLERGSDTAPRPSLDSVVANGGDHTEWMRNISSWTDDGDMAARSAIDAHETTILAVMQYRKALSSASMVVKPHLPPGGVRDDLGPLVDDDSEDLLALGRRCAELAKCARRDAEAVPLFLRIKEMDTQVSAGVGTLRDELVRAINSAAWSTRSLSSLPTNLIDDLEALEVRAAECDCDMDLLRAIPTTSEAMPSLEAMLEQRKQDISEAHHELNVFHRVSGQADTVRELQSEAERLVEELEAAADSLPDADAETYDSLVVEFRSRVAEWNDNIIPRVAFVSGEEPSTPSWPSCEESRTANGPLTPPLTPVGREDQSSGFMTTMPDLVALDKRVRNEVNHQSASVSASLARLVSVHDRLAFERWAAPVRTATESLKTAKQELQTTLTRLMDELQVLNKDNDQSARQVQAVESLQLGAEAIGKHAAVVEGLVGNLNEVLGADASAGIDMRKAADVFSAADVTREAALSQITKAERWQRQLEDAVAQSLLARSITPVGQNSDEIPRTPEQMAKKIKSLNGGLDALAIEAIVHPSPAQLRATPKMRRLPSSSDAKTLAKTFTSIADSARSIARSQPNSPEVKRLLDKVATQGSFVPDLEVLGSVSDAAAVCDEAFSRLLDTVDSGAGREATVAAEREAQSAVETLEEIAQPLLSDTRVAQERRRVTTAWRELRAVAEDESMASSSGPAIAGSSATASTRIEMPRKPRLSLNPVGPAVSRRTSTLRATVDIEPTQSGTPTPKRMSDTTKGRTARHRPSLESIPFSRANANTNPETPKPRNSLPSRPTARTFTPTVPVPFRLSRSTSSYSSLAEQAGDGAATPAKSRARLSDPPPSTSFSNLRPQPKVKAASKAAPKPKSRLDVAVARVLEGLDVRVPMVPAGRRSPDEWKDESGRYWIGTGPRARMCFCRILRSRTVMVRVGGGWIELSRYLLDHFDEVEATEGGEWNTSPVVVTSTSLKASTGSKTPASSSSVRTGKKPSMPSSSSSTALTRTRTGASASSSGSSRPVPYTPARASLPAQFQFQFQLSPDNATTPLPIRASSHSPEKATGPGSPLIPLQFLRKASESPSVRDKERETLRRTARA